MNPGSHRLLFSAFLVLRRVSCFVRLHQNSVVEAFWKKGVRSDGRLFAEARRYSVQHGVLNHAAGSALVKCSQASVKGSSSSSSSSTVVLAAVTLLVGQPSAAAPKQGDVIVTVVVAAPASGAISSSSGAPSSTSNIPQLQAFLQRILEENVDLAQLVITEGKLAYRLAVTISLLEDSGSATDACLAAAVAALLDTQLPVQPLVMEDGVVYSSPDHHHNNTNSESSSSSSTDYKKALRMPIVPCSLTAAGARFNREGTAESSAQQQLQHHWIVDPDTDEQKVQQSVVTVVVNAAAVANDDDDDNNDNNVLGVHFCSIDPLSQGITTTELARIIHMATGHAADLYAVLQRP